MPYDLMKAGRHRRRTFFQAGIPLTDKLAAMLCVATDVRAAGFPAFVIREKEMVQCRE